MEIFKCRTFYRWSRSEKLNDKTLKEAIFQIEQWLFDANLGSGLYKQRVPMKGQKNEQAPFAKYTFW